MQGSTARDSYGTISETRRQSSLEVSYGMSINKEGKYLESEKELNLEDSADIFIVSRTSMSFNK